MLQCSKCLLPVLFFSRGMTSEALKLREKAPKDHGLGKTLSKVKERYFTAQHDILV